MCVRADLEQDRTGDAVNHERKHAEHEQQIGRPRHDWMMEDGEARLGVISPAPPSTEVDSLGTVVVMFAAEGSVTVINTAVHLRELVQL